MIRQSFAEGRQGARDPRAQVRSVVGLLLGFVVMAGPFFERAFPGTFRHLTPFYVAMGILLASPLLVPRTPGRALRFPGWMWAMAGVALVAAVTAPFADSITDATADTARYVLVFTVLGVSWFFRGDISWRRGGLLGLLIGAAVFTGGIAEWSLSDVIVPGRFEPLINRNLSGAVMAVAVLSSILLREQLPAQWRLPRLLVAGAGLFFSYMVFMTASRGSLLSIVVAVAFLVWGTPRLSARLGLATAAGLVVVVALTFYTDYDEAIRLQERDDADRFSTGRTSIWRGILEELPKTDYLGAGTGNTRALVGGSDSFLRSDYGRVEGTGGSAHSIYMKVLAENGIPGVIPLVVFFVGLLRYCWGLRRITPYPLAAAVFTSVYLAFCDYSFPPWMVLGLSWPLAAAAAAAAPVRIRPTADRWRRARPA